MSIPKFKILTSDFSPAEEEKLLAYLHHVATPHTDRLNFYFHFVSDHEYKIIALRDEAIAEGFSVYLLKTEMHRGRAFRSRLVLQKELFLHTGEIHKEFEYLVGLAETYRVHFSELEPEKG